MPMPSQRKPILNEQAFNSLRDAREQILEAVAGTLPERLIVDVTTAAVRLARRESLTEQVAPERVLDLVRATLQSLARPDWKPDTALLLQKGRREDKHE